MAWTEEEHKSFLIGLQKLGKGDWRGISRHFVQTRTPTQVASHAQKYFIRQTNVSKRKRRHSLFDLVASPNEQGEDGVVRTSMATIATTTATKTKSTHNNKSSAARVNHNTAKQTAAAAAKQQAQVAVACESALTASLSNLADLASREPHYVASTHHYGINSTSRSDAVKVEEDAHRPMPTGTDYAPFGASPPGGFCPSMFDAYNQAMTQYMSQLQALAAQQGDGQSHLNQINQMNQLAWMAQQNLAYQMAAQSFATNARNQQMAQMTFCRPTAMYAAKASAERKAASGGA